MKTKVMSIAIILLLMSSAGFASPLTEYSEGRIALDVSWRPSEDVNNSHEGRTDNFDYGITVGLGKNFAFQYRNSKGDSADYGIAGTIMSKTTLQAREFTVLYKINKNISAFTGAVNVTPGMALTYLGPHVTATIAGNPIIAGQSTDNKSTTGYQLGIVGSTKLAKKLTAYGVIGFGNIIENYEIGLGYEVVKNLELNVGYRTTKYKRLNLTFKGDEVTQDLSYKVKGMVYGATYKF